MKIKFFDPAKGYSKIRDEVLGEIDRVLSAGDLILRDDVEKFEKSLAEYVGTKYCVALNSGTDALYLSLKALGIGKGDEVLVPSYTFVATAQVVKQCGATPIQYDMDGLLIFNRNEVKAIIPVHMEGKFADHFEEILKIANERRWYVIEDSAQALGAEWKGKKAGSFGNAGCFSFYPAKILGNFGDAGALVTNDKKMYNYVREARNHFKESNSDWGLNSRLDNVWASVLNIKFKYLSQVLKIRENIAAMYLKAFKELEEDGFVSLPENTTGRVWQDFCIRINEKQ